MKRGQHIPLRKRRPDSLLESFRLGAQEAVLDRGKGAADVRDGPVQVGQAREGAGQNQVLDRAGRLEVELDQAGRVSRCLLRRRG